MDMIAGQKALLYYYHGELLSYYRNLYGPTFQTEGRAKMESLGHFVGLKFAEKFVMSQQIYAGVENVIKLIYQDFWSSFFGRNASMSNPKEDSYVIEDSNFAFLTSISNGDQYKDSFQDYTAYVCGLIRGIMEAWGYSCSVTSEIVKCPACRFCLTCNMADWKRKPHFVL